MSRKLITIVIPVYNEAEILKSSVESLYKSLEEFKDAYDFELILAENGSKDKTIEIGEALSAEHEKMSIFHHPEPDYGMALKAGILKARGEIVVCDEIDLCLLPFYREALSVFEKTDADMVVGSKAMKGADDRRPFKRKFATFVLNFMLKVVLGFKGTDTHGVKAFRKKALIPVLDKCLVGKDIFASEFVIRAEKMGKKVVEIPVSLDEKRAPSIKLMKRVPKVLSNIAYLFWAIRVKNK